MKIRVLVYKMTDLAEVFLGGIVITLDDFQL